MDNIGSPNVMELGDESSVLRYLQANYYELCKIDRVYFYLKISDSVSNVVVTGLPFETYMAQYIFKPCTMNYSTFLLDTSVLKASPHIHNSSGVFEYSVIYPYSRCHAASSTLHSNIQDMLKWKFAILNKGHCILSEKSYRLFIGGLGLFIDDWNGKMLLNHAGSDLGFSSYVGLVPKDSVAVVFMSNLHRFVPYKIITNTLLNAVYDRPNPQLQKPTMP